MKTRTASLIVLASSLCFASGVAAAPPPPTLLKNINPGAAGSQVWQLVTVDVNGTVYFSALREEFGKELWKSDGTKHGTVMVKDIYPGLYGVYDGIPSGIWSTPAELTNVAGTLFFAAESPGVGFALRKSDGTEAGTVIVSDLVYPNDMVAAGSLAFFTPFFSPRFQLYVSDGTEAGTIRLTGLTPGVPPHDGSDPIAVGTTVYFSATNGVTSRLQQLWKTDGTVAGTSQVMTLSGSAEIQDMGFSGGAFGSLLLFKVCDTVCPSACSQACQLWRTDGTGPGTFALTSLVQLGGPASRPVDAGSQAFLLLDDTGTGEELWKTDGTVAGTGMVVELEPGASGFGDAGIRTLVAKDGDVYFLVDELYGPGLGGLWRSDGSAPGTTRVAAFQVDSYSYSYELVNADGTLLFRVEEPDGRLYLWRSDGTPGGTGPVAETFGRSSISYAFTAAGGALFFSEFSDRYGWEPMIYLASCGDGNVGTGEQCDNGASNGLDGICTTACTKVDDVDDDGVLNAADNCPSDWNPGQEDGDGDDEGDACEVCVGGGAATKQQIKISKLNTTLADDKLTVKGIATVTTAPWVGPDLLGAIVRIEDSTGATVLDAEIPAFEYDAVYLDGWKTNGSYTSFTYLNKNAGGLLGLTKVGLKIDLATGVLKFTVKGKNGSFGFDPMNLPLTGIVALDAEKPVVGQCAVATFPNPPGTPGSCTLKPDGSSVKCK